MLAAYRNTSRCRIARRRYLFSANRDGCRRSLYPGLRRGHSPGLARGPRHGRSGESSLPGDLASSLPSQRGLGRIAWRSSLRSNSPQIPVRCPPGGGEPYRTRFAPPAELRGGRIMQRLPLRFRLDISHYYVIRAITIFGGSGRKLARGKFQREKRQDGDELQFLRSNPRPQPVRILRAERQSEIMRRRKS